jgi:hypothetical protein
MFKPINADDKHTNTLIPNTMKALARNTYIYQVMKWLQSGKTITSKQAYDEFGCTRLSAVIFRLINEYEMPITKDMVVVKNRNGRFVEIAKYYLAVTHAA